MRFFVTEAAREVGIVNPVIALYRNVFVAPEASKLYDPHVDEVMRKVKSIRENVLPTPEVQGFRTIIQGLGYPKVDPAGERILNGCERRNEFKRYGNLVDAYNIAALEYVAGLGVHDAGRVQDVDIIYRRAHGDEKMVPAFEKGEKTVKKGDLCYGYHHEGKFVPFAWIGKKDVDNSEFQLNNESTSFILTAIGNDKTSSEHNTQICKRAFELLKVGCPEATMELLYPTFISNDEVIPADPAEEELITALEEVVIE